MPRDRERIELRDERTPKRIAIVALVVIGVSVAVNVLGLPWWAVLLIGLPLVVWMPMFFFPRERGWRRRAE